MSIYQSVYLCLYVAGRVCVIGQGPSRLALEFRNAFSYVSMFVYQTIYLCAWRGVFALYDRAPVG